MSVLPYPKLSDAPFVVLSDWVSSLRSFAYYLYLLKSRLFAGRHNHGQGL